MKRLLILCLLGCLLLTGCGPSNSYLSVRPHTEAPTAQTEAVEEATTVVTNRNARYLGQLPDLALWLGNVSGVGLDLFRPLGRGSEQSLAPKEGELIQGLSELARRTVEIRAVGIPFRLRELERLKKRMACETCSGIYCYAQTEQSICVDADGNCWPCSSLAGNTAFYIGNIQDSATAGFKYFDCRDVKEIRIKVRGYADGVFEVKTTWDGEVLARLKVEYSNVWEEYSAPVTISDGVHAIYITYRGNGNAGLKSFTLA